MRVAVVLLFNLLLLGFVIGGGVFSVTRDEQVRRGAALVGGVSGTLLLVGVGVLLLAVPRRPKE